MKIIRNMICIAFCIFAMLSCKTNTYEIETYLKQLEKEFPNISSDGWKTKKKVNELGSIHYYITKEKEDTLFLIDFYYHQEAGVYEFINFFKEYVVDSYAYRLGFGADGDTTYLFKYKFKGLDKMIKEEDMHFIQGKYYYLYNFGGLSKKQKQYYEKHADSLCKLKGNDLPPLPKK